MSRITKAPIYSVVRTVAFKFARIESDCQVKTAALDSSGYAELVNAVLFLFVHIPPVRNVCDV